MPPPRSAAPRVCLDAFLFSHDNFSQVRFLDLRAFLEQRKCSKSSEMLPCCTYATASVTASSACVGLIRVLHTNLGSAGPNACLPISALLRACPPPLQPPQATADCARAPPRAGDAHANRSSSGVASFDTTVFEAAKATSDERSALEPRPALPAPAAVRVVGGAATLGLQTLRSEARAPAAPLGALARAGTAPPAPAAVPHQGFLPYKWRHHGSAMAAGAGVRALSGGADAPVGSCNKRPAPEPEQPLLQPPRKRLHAAYSSGA